MNITNLKSVKKSKKYDLIKKIPKIQFTIKIALVRPIFGHKINFAVNIWKEAQEQKQQMISEDIVNQRSMFPFRTKCQVKNVFPWDVESTVGYKWPAKS